jgi:2-polyprenyl-3-methyl-5-hydroxy-6-metoxy-1,4-benzoquinol methylase
MLWNKIAKLYEEKFMDLDIYNESYDFFCDQIEKENAEILELACGPGNITRYMLRQKPHWQFTATDYAEEMVKLAQVNNPQATCEVMGMLDIREKKERYDGIICGFGLPYVQPHELEEFIHQVAQHLHPKGVCYLSFVAGDESQSGLKTNSQGDTVFFHYYPLQRILDLFEKNHKKALKSFTIQYPQHKEDHTILILLNP